MTVKTIYMLNRHTRSHLKKSISYSQPLRFKRINSTFEEYRKHSQNLKQNFFENGFNESTVRKQIERVDHLDGSSLLRHCKPKCKGSILFWVTHNLLLPNIRKVTKKHRHILSINSSFKETFNNIRPMIAFLKRVFLKQPIGTNTIKNNEKFLTPTKTTTSRQCTPCFPRR